MDADAIAEFSKKFQNVVWRVVWNYEPYEEEGFYVIAEDPISGETVRAAFSDTELLANVVCVSLNTFCRMASQYNV